MECLVYMVLFHSSASVYDCYIHCSSVFVIGVNAVCMLFVANHVLACNASEP